MRTIGLDLRPTEAGFKAHAGRGTGRYATELVHHLHALIDKEPELAARLRLVPVSGTEAAPASAEQRLGALLPFGRRTFESQILFPRRLSRLGLDLVHFFAHGDAPALPAVPQLVTVLDLIPLRFPDLYRGARPNWRFRFGRFLEQEAVRRSIGVLAISESTKQDIVSFLGVPEDRIEVTPLGVADRFFAAPRQPQAALRRQLGLPHDDLLLLYVGGIDPRKNVFFLLEVFAALCERCENVRLALAGRYEDDDNYPALQAEIERLRLGDRLLLLGFVPDERLVDLYHAADIKVFPSLFEGFGLPVLEAMAAGLPVAAGDNSSLPELAGEGALLLPDNNPAAWLSALQELIVSPQRRRELAAAGRARAQTFTWERTAGLTAAAYLKFLGMMESASGKLSSRPAKEQDRHAASQ